ncbi:hypothetical protein G6F54_014533 [Rhizopus delemar]|nr:hypothetical protein G6F54_014533 [Rhizopus delemar]
MASMPTTTLVVLAISFGFSVTKVVTPVSSSVSFTAASPTAGSNAAPKALDRLSTAIFAPWIFSGSVCMALA